MSLISNIYNWVIYEKNKPLRDYLTEVKVKNEEERKEYGGFFFNSIKWITRLLLTLGILASILIYFTYGEVFKATAIFFLLIWLVVFFRYFLWSVYHYNINYGLTNNDWKDIKIAQEKKEKGIPVDERQLEEPQYNPYRSQTFGLPPGTVRGMIAFTILFGSITILIASMGMSDVDQQNSLIRDQFEFFKTAFLMMIAFYFGDKSLRYLQKRWNDPNKSDSGDHTNSVNQKDSETENQVDIDNRYFDADVQKFAETEEPEEIQKNKKAGLLKRVLSSSLSTSFIDTKVSVPDLLKKEYKQVEDNIYRKVLSDEHLKKAIEDLKDKKGIILQLPVLKAIIEVESGGRGHLSDGRPKILFEGHKFWKWLTKLDKGGPANYVKGNEDIIYEKWTKNFYIGGAGEYTRYERAKKINEKAAIYSTSWGLFQIMGENLTGNINSRINSDENQHNKDLYNIDINSENGSLEDFVKKQGDSEYYHLLDFLAFIQTKQVKGKTLINYVSGNNEQDFDWATFAYGYNGGGYEANKYDVKLKNAFNKHSQSLSEAAPAIKTRIPIIDAGHGGINASGKYTTTIGKRYKFTGTDQNNFEIFEGVINRKIAQKLIAKLKDAGMAYYDLNSTDQTDMSLEARVKVADNLYKNNKSYYYLSIHSNSSSKELEGTGTTANGFEIYTSLGSTSSDLFAKIAAEKYKTLFPKVKFRGLKESNFYVLKYTDCPAFLVENLFFDNFKEAQYLSSDKGQEEIANCLFEVVKSIT